VLAFFKNDPFDPQGRSTGVEPILSQNGVAHLVIDHPDHLTGHSAGRSKAFADRFGGCLLIIADYGTTPYTCDDVTARAKQ
jgi:hypothetical protein